MKINIKRARSGKYQLTFSPFAKVKIILWVKSDETMNCIYNEFQVKLLKLKKGKNHV